MSSLVSYNITRNLQLSANNQIKDILASQGIIKSNSNPSSWSDDLTHLMNECVSTVKVGLELMESKFLWSLSSREFETPLKFVAEFGWGRACYQVILNGLEDKNLKQYLTWLDQAVDAYFSVKKAKVHELIALIDSCTSNKNFDLKHNLKDYIALKERLVSATKNLPAYREEIKHCIAMQDLKIKVLGLDKSELDITEIDKRTPLASLFEKFETDYISIVESQKLLKKSYNSYAPDSSIFNLKWNKQNTPFLVYKTLKPLISTYAGTCKNGSPIALNHIKFGGEKINLSIYVVFKEYIDSITTKLDETFWYVNKDFIAQQAASSKASWDLAKKESKLDSSEITGISNQNTSGLGLVSAVITTSTLGAVITHGVSLLGCILALGVCIAKFNSAKSDSNTPVESEIENVKQIYNEVKADIRASKSNMLKALQTLHNQ